MVTSPQASGGSLPPQCMGVLRYGGASSACPDWFMDQDQSDQKFFIPKIQTAPGPFMNNVSAIFHMVKEDCELLPFPAIVSNDQNKMGIRSDMRFVKVQYKSIAEARRRAYVVAVLSHSFISQTFVRMFTKEMLEEGFFYVNIKELWELYNLQGVQDVIEPPATRSSIVNKLTRQPHNGVLLRDATVLRSTAVFTKAYNVKDQGHGVVFHCELDEKRDHYHHKKIGGAYDGSNRKSLMTHGVTPDIHPSLSTAADPLMTQQQSSILNQYSHPHHHHHHYPYNASITFKATPTNQSITQQQNINKNLGRIQSSITSTNSSQPTKNQILTSFVQLNAAKVKLQRQINKQKIQNQQQQYIDNKKQFIKNMKQIEGTIKREQKTELQRNLNMFYSINIAEKKLRNDILQRQRQNILLIKQEIKDDVNRTQKKIQIQRSNRQFCQNFAQQKNLISKQMKIGQILRRQKMIQNTNAKMVQQMKNQREERAKSMSRLGNLHNKVPLRTQLFDSQSVMSTSSFYKKKGSQAPDKRPKLQLTLLSQSVIESGNDDYDIQGQFLNYTKNSYMTDSRNKLLGNSYTRPPVNTTLPPINPDSRTGGGEISLQFDDDTQIYSQNERSSQMRSAEPYRNAMDKKQRKKDIMLMRGTNDSNNSNRLSGNQYFDSITGLKNAVYIHSSKNNTSLDSQNVKVPHLPKLLSNDKKNPFFDKRKSQAMNTSSFI